MPDFPPVARPCQPKPQSLTLSVGPSQLASLSWPLSVGPAKAEVRLIYAGDGEGMPTLVNQLVRLTKGAMHGVDFNKGRTWVGASAGFHAPL